MERLIFKTSKGSITIGYGGKYVLSSTPKGLNECEVTRQTTTYIKTDGASYTDPLYSPRQITVNGFINAVSPAEMANCRAELSRVLSGKEEGTLYYDTGYKRYFAEAIVNPPEFGENPLQCKLPFVVFFTLPKVYWKQDKKHIESVYELVNHVSGSFTLPCVFTERLNHKTVINNGHRDADMVIIVDCDTYTPPDNVYGILIENKTTGEYIQLDYNIQAGERITIDTEKCTVKSSIATSGNDYGNIFYSMTESSTFFKLTTGANEIEATSLNPNCRITISLEYYHVMEGI